MSTYALSQEVSIHEQMKVELRALYPDADEATILDTLEGETDVVELIVKVLESAIDDQTMTAVCGLRINDLKARIERLEHRAEQKRKIAQMAMERTGRKKIEAAEMTVSLRAVPQAVIITAPEQIPDAFMVQPEPPPKRPDKRAILDALKRGQRVEGCTLSNGGMTLSMRTK